MKVIAILIHLHDLYGIVFRDLNEQMKLVVQSHAMQHNITSFLSWPNNFKHCNITSHHFQANLIILGIAK
jgi:hypothetical protein